jgi:ABC-2 type transport system permease protein
VVDNDASSESAALIGNLRLSRYFEVRPAHSMADANTMLLDRAVDGVLLIPSDFARRSHSGDADVQMLVNGTDANQARIMQGYARGPFAQGARGGLDLAERRRRAP